MPRDIRVYLDDIIESTEKIESYIAGISKKGFDKDIKLQDAVVRRLEIIGEAVKHIPDEVKQKHSKVEWRKIAGARDIFAHEYFGVELDRVWKIISKDLSKLKNQIQDLLNSLGG